MCSGHRRGDSRSVKEHWPPSSPPDPGAPPPRRVQPLPAPGGALPQKLPEPWLGVAVLRRRPPLRTRVSSVLTALPRGPRGTNAASALDPTPTARSHTGSRGRHLHGSRVRAFPVWKAFPISDAQLRSESLGRSRGGQAGAQGRSQGPLSTFQSQLPFLKSAPPTRPQRAFTLMALSVNCLASLYLSNLGEEVESWGTPRFNSAKERRTSRQTGPLNARNTGGGGIAQPPQLPCLRADHTWLPFPPS